jgi:hypothetical protein
MAKLKGFLLPVVSGDCPPPNVHEKTVEILYTKKLHKLFSVHQTRCVLYPFPVLLQHSVLEIKVPIKLSLSGGFSYLDSSNLDPDPDQSCFRSRFRVFKAPGLDSHSEYDPGRFVM